MKRNNRKKLNIGVKKAVAVMTSAFMLVSSLCLPEVSQEIKDIVISASAKTSHPMTTYNVNSLKELYEFSEKYKDDPDEYQYIDLIIDINGDITIQDELEFDSSNGKVKLHFYPIGTSEYPFGGKITLSMGMNDTQSMTVDKPLFDYICGSEFDGTRSKKSEVVKAVLEHFEIQKCSDQALMIGDRKYDVLGASAVGVPCLGVRYGYGEPGELEEAGAIVVVDSIKELEAYLIK